MKIPLIYAWARSGATVLNKCLLAMGHIVLSELHPKINSGVHAPRWQGRNWFDMELPSGTPWRDCIVQLDALCEQRKKRLLVRDWTVNSFYPSEENNYKPIHRLHTHEAMGSMCLPVAYVRDAIDCALSFAKFHGWTHTRELDRYTHAYLKYIEQIRRAKIPVFRYEKFCRAPDKFLKQLCDYLGIKYSDSWRNFAKVTKVNGDVFHKRSRASAAKSIQVLPRIHERSMVVSKIKSNSQLRLANQRLMLSA